jgi:uncharacterized repeat protein (TIGR03803 family)
VLVDGSDKLNVPANSTSFTMPARVAYASSYALTVQTQPTNLTCSVSHGTGTMGAGPVTNIGVACAATTYTIGGTISGLSAGGLVLGNGTDSLSVAANASTFTMPIALADGASFSVAVASTPAAIACSLQNGSGVVSGSNVTNISISCSAGTESVLYAFGNAPDGNFPFGTVMQASDGNLYGMTSQGGVNNAGTVFEVTPAGAETVLWSFGGGSDGAIPDGDLIQAGDGNFYGMTNQGGMNGLGTVFKITPAGVETVLWSFGAAGDGSQPYGDLVQASDGNFYGMTSGGGTNATGVIFEITPSSTESVLYSFGPSNGTTDGAYPQASLIQASDGNFYGTTGYGGPGNAGTVFRLTPAGAYSTLYFFAGSTDGGHPNCTLLQASDGNLYGATADYGAHGHGTVFRITTTGLLTTLYSFAGQPDVDSAYGALIQATDGNLYGTSDGGGAFGYGSVFSISLAGAESIVHSFGNAPDGQYPYYTPLLQATNGHLYGLTPYGGANGNGIVFDIN